MTLTSNDDAEKNMVSLKFKCTALYILLYISSLYIYIYIYIYIYMTANYKYSIKYEGMIIITFHVISLIFMVFYLFDVKVKYLNSLFGRLVVICLVVTDLYEIISSALISYNHNFPIFAFIIVFAVQTAWLGFAWPISWIYVNGKTCNGLKFK